MRELKLNDPLHPEGGPTIKVKHDKDCVFCKHCADIFWDYTHGPYMIFVKIITTPQKDRAHILMRKKKMTHEYIIKKLDDIISAEKQIMETNCQILDDINEAEKKIKETNNDTKTAI